MEEVCGGTKPFLSTDHLESEHRRIKDKSLALFSSKRKMGGEEFSEKYKIRLEEVSKFMRIISYNKVISSRREDCSRRIAGRNVLKNGQFMTNARELDGKTNRYCKMLRSDLGKTRVGTALRLNASNLIAAAPDEQRSSAHV